LKADHGEPRRIAAGGDHSATISGNSLADC
jgi:hypothetical protein